MSVVSFSLDASGVAKAFTEYQKYMKNRREERIKLTDANLYEKSFGSTRHLWCLGFNSNMIEVRIVPVIAKKSLDDETASSSDETASSSDENELDDEIKTAFSNAEKLTDIDNLIDSNKMVDQTARIKQFLGQLLWFAIEKDDISRVTVKHLVDIAHVILGKKVTFLEFCSLENRKRRWNVVLVLANGFDFPCIGTLTEQVYKFLADPSLLSKGTDGSPSNRQTGQDEIHSSDGATVNPERRREGKVE